LREKKREASEEGRKRGIRALILSRVAKWNKLCETKGNPVGAGDRKKRVGGGR